MYRGSPQWYDMLNEFDDIVKTLRVDNITEEYNDGFVPAFTKRATQFLMENQHPSQMTIEELNTWAERINYYAPDQD